MYFGIGGFSALRAPAQGAALGVYISLSAFYPEFNRKTRA
jgi:hypothetical protein